MDVSEKNFEQAIEQTLLDGRPDGRRCRAPETISS